MGIAPPFSNFQFAIHGLCRVWLQLMENMSNHRSAKGASYFFTVVTYRWHKFLSLFIW